MALKFAAAEFQRNEGFRVSMTGGAIVIQFTTRAAD